MQMIEAEQLTRAITKLSTCTDGWKRPPLEKAVLLWGGRLYRWTQDTAVTLEKQLRWLDANTTAPTYDQRFTEWTALLKQYEQACDLLAGSVAA